MEWWSVATTLAGTWQTPNRPSSVRYPIWIALRVTFGASSTNEAANDRSGLEMNWMAPTGIQSVPKEQLP